MARILSSPDASAPALRWGSGELENKHVPLPHPSAPARVPCGNLGRRGQGQVRPRRAGDDLI